MVPEMLFPNSEKIGKSISGTNSFLADKLERIILGKKSEEEQRIAKIRRQKRKRSKRAKDKMLEDKHRRSEVKQGRSFRPPED
jgi:hypothetical protein